MLYPLSYEGGGCRLLGRELWSRAWLGGLMGLEGLPPLVSSDEERGWASCGRPQARQGDVRSDVEVTCGAWALYAASWV